MEHVKDLAGCREYADSDARPDTPETGGLEAGSKHF
jgi:hypothetical protein